MAWQSKKALRALIKELEYSVDDGRRRASGYFDKMHTWRKRAETAEADLAQMKAERIAELAGAAPSATPYDDFVEKYAMGPYPSSRTPWRCHGAETGRWKGGGFANRPNYSPLDGPPSQELVDMMKMHRRIAALRFIEQEIGG